MNKCFTIALVAVACLAVSSWAQETSALLKPVNELSTLGDQSKASEPKVKKSSAAKGSKPADSKGPTDITCTKGVTFDEKSRKGVFTGNVRVLDPQFNLTSDKLTVFLKKEQAPATGKAKAAPEPTLPDDSTGGGLERAIAEGHVVVVQDKPAENGAEAKHYVGKANKLDYDAKTGDVVLTGWPQIQQGINIQAATEEGTVMTINRNGSLNTKGGTHTIFQSDDSSK